MWYSSFLSFYPDSNSRFPQRYWDDFWYKKRVIKISLVFYYDYLSEFEDMWVPIEQWIGWLDYFYNFSLVWTNWQVRYWSIFHQFLGNWVIGRFRLFWYVIFIWRTCCSCWRCAYSLWFLGIRWITCQSEERRGRRANYGDSSCFLPRDCAFEKGYSALLENITT